MRKRNEINFYFTCRLSNTLSHKQNRCSVNTTQLSHFTCTGEMNSKSPSEIRLNTNKFLDFVNYQGEFFECISSIILLPKTKISKILNFLWWNIDWSRGKCQNNFSLARAKKYHKKQIFHDWFCTLVKEYIKKGRVLYNNYQEWNLFISFSLSKK